MLYSDVHVTLCVWVTGDAKDGKTTTLCVRRATFWCPELKADDPTKKGVCSNYLCDAKPNDEIKLTGPSGKVQSCIMSLIVLGFYFCHIVLVHSVYSAGIKKKVLHKESVFADSWLF